MKYKRLIPAGEDLVMFMHEPQRWGIIDYDENIIVPPEFTHSGVFINGVMSLQKEDGINYLVSKDGKVIKE